MTNRKPHPAPWARRLALEHAERQKPAEDVVPLSHPGPLEILDAMPGWLASLPTPEDVEWEECQEMIRESLWRIDHPEEDSSEES